MTGISSAQLFDHKILLARGIVRGLLDILQGYQNFTLLIVTGNYPQRCSFLFPLQLNKIFCFYIVCLGFARGKQGA